MKAKKELTAKEAIIGVVTLLVFAFLGWQIFKPFSNAIENTPEPTPTATVAPVELSEEEKILVVRTAFMANCDKNGTNRDFCACSFSELGENYTIDEIIAMSEDLNSEKARDAIFSATLACYEYNQ